MQSIAITRHETKTGRSPGQCQQALQVTLEVVEISRISRCIPALFKAIAGHDHSQSRHLHQALLRRQEAQPGFKQAHPRLLAIGIAQQQPDSELDNSTLLRIEKEANQLDKMIADVLQVSRLEANSQPLSLQAQSLQVIVDHVINDAQFEAKQHNKTLHIQGDAEVNIECDEMLIASALENIFFVIMYLIWIMLEIT